MESRLLENLGIDPAYLFIAMFAMIVLLFIFSISINMKYNRLKNNSHSFIKEKEGKTLEESNLAQLKETYQKTGLVRYNAFDDTENKLSFALTLLDGDDNGFVLDVMHTRDRCYTYIKEIIKGQSFIELTEEESESLDRAIFQEAYGLNFKESN